MIIIILNWTGTHLKRTVGDATCCDAVHPGAAELAEVHADAQEGEVAVPGQRYGATCS